MSGQTSGNMYTACLKGGALMKVAIGTGGRPGELERDRSPRIARRPRLLHQTGQNAATIGDGQEVSATAFCDTGDVATGGGIDGTLGVGVILARSTPWGVTGWLAKERVRVRPLCRHHAVVPGRDTGRAGSRHCTAMRCHTGDASQAVERLGDSTGGHPRPRVGARREETMRLAAASPTAQ